MTNYGERFEELDHFDGALEKLQRMVSMTGIEGIWRDLNDHKQQQFVAANGAFLNFYPSTQRINFQGKSEATNEIRNKLTPVIYEHTNTLAKYL